MVPEDPEVAYESKRSANHNRSNQSGQQSKRSEGGNKPDS